MSYRAKENTSHSADQDTHCFCGIKYEITLLIEAVSVTIGSIQAKYLAPDARREVV